MSVPYYFQLSQQTLTEGREYHLMSTVVTSNHYILKAVYSMGGVLVYTVVLLFYQSR